MTEQGPRDPDGAGRSPWLPPAVEADVYEGIRLGDEDAFHGVAEPLQPVLLRLAGLPGDGDTQAALRVVRAWGLALSGLDMFRWQTPFATWVAGITVTLGRSAPQRRAGPAAEQAAPPTERAAPPPERAPAGPPDWSDLPWGARWPDAWETLGAAVARLPLAQREAVHATDVEEWPASRVSDVLGRPANACGRLLVAGRRQLRDALAGLVQAGPAEPHLDFQIAAVAAMLPALRTPHEAALDARTVEGFRRWRRTRRRGRRRLPLRGRAA